MGMASQVRSKTSSSSLLCWYWWYSCDIDLGGPFSVVEVVDVVVIAAAVVVV